MKINFRRLKAQKWKGRVPVPNRPGKVILPESVYNRKKEKSSYLKDVELYMEDWNEAAFM